MHFSNSMKRKIKTAITRKIPLASEVISQKSGRFGGTGVQTYVEPIAPAPPHFQSISIIELDVHCSGK